MNLSVIPEQLTERPQWVLWRSEQRGNQITKVPFTPSGTHASVTNPTTWVSLKQALQCLSTPGIDGLGFVLTEEDPLACIDLDHVRVRGEISPWAHCIVEAFRTYCEISPSGTGLHLWLEVDHALPGRKFSGKKLRDAGLNAEEGHALECYYSGRYMTVTGIPFGNPLPLRNCASEISDLLRRLDQQDTAPAREASRLATCEYSGDDDSLLRRAFESCNGAEIEALWRGDTSGYPSASEADLALCSHLAFWLGGDPERIDATFRRSGLYRDKWDRRHGAMTYGANTIARALACCSDFFEPKRNGRYSKENHSRRISGVGKDLEAMRDMGIEPEPAITCRPFPTYALPSPVREFARVASESLAVPIEWVALPALVSAGSLWGGSVEIKPGHWEPTILWWLGVAPPSSAKTPTLHTALTPLLRIDSDLHSERARALEVFQADLDRYQRKEKRGFSDRPSRPVIPQVRLDNATVEAVFSVSQANSKFPLLASDELTGFLASFNAYRSGRGGDVEFWLSAFNGQPFTVNRATRDPLHISRLGISICGFSTPGGISCALRTDAAPLLVLNGFLGRFALSMPSLHARKYTEASIPRELIDDVEDVFRTLWNSPPVTLCLDPEAKKTWVNFYDRIQGRCVGEPEAFQHFLGKQAGRAARIAGVIASIKNDDFVSVESMQEAIEITEWMGRETLQAYTLLRVCAPPTQEILFEYLLDHPGVSVSEIARSGPRILRRLGVAGIEKCLGDLSSAGRIRFETGAKSGRPTERWVAVAPTPIQEAVEPLNEFSSPAREAVEPLAEQEFDSGADTPASLDSGPEESTDLERLAQNLLAKMREGI